MYHEGDRITFLIGSLGGITHGNGVSSGNKKKSGFVEMSGWKNPLPGTFYSEEYPKL
jgi:hypothetical protein